LFGTSDEAVRALSGVIALTAVVVSWFAARHWFDRATAWLTVIVMMTNPYVIRYATETRMYSLEILLVACGLLIVPRAIERPTLARLALVALLTAALAYTQYWTFYVIGVTGLTLLVAAWRSPNGRGAYLRVVGSMAAGMLLFVPWLPTFMSQRAHTGTPWGVPVLPGIPIGTTFLGFAGGYQQEGWVLLFLLFAALLLGVFARPVDGYTLAVDLRAQPDARALAIVGGATLVVGVSLNYLAGQAFEPRYSALVFPFFALLVARGLTTFRDVRVQVGAVAALSLFGLIGGVRNATEQRTQAGEVADVIRASAKPGDVVLYCPDQLGPSVHRLLPKGFDQVTYPVFARPEFVNWVDYQKRFDSVDPAAFAADVDRRAGAHTIWLVSGPGYPNLHNTCDELAGDLAARRADSVRVVPNENLFESSGLQEFAPPKQ
jgi:hypothetical protein